MKNLILAVFSLFACLLNAQTQTFLFPQSAHNETKVNGDFIAPMNDTLYFYGYTCKKGNAAQNLQLAQKRIVSAMVAYNLAGYRGVFIPVVIGETDTFGVDSLNRRVVVKAKRSKGNLFHKVTMKDTIKICRDTFIKDTIKFDSIRPLQLIMLNEIKIGELPVKIDVSLIAIPEKSCPCKKHEAAANAAFFMFKSAKDKWRTEKDEWTSESASDSRYDMGLALREYTELKTKAKQCYVFHRKIKANKEPKKKSRQRIVMRKTRGKSGRGLARIFPYINC